MWNEVDLRLDQGITDAVLYTLLQNKVITVYLPTFWNPEQSLTFVMGDYGQNLVDQELRATSNYL